MAGKIAIGLAFDGPIPCACLFGNIRLPAAATLTQPGGNCYFVEVDKLLRVHDADEDLAIAAKDAIRREIGRIGLPRGHLDWRSPV
jgi:hypothetical protein